MTPLEVLCDPLGQRLAWTLLHFVWQGLLIATALAVVAGLFPRARAENRYAMALAGLLLMAICPPVTFALLGVWVPPKNGQSDVAAVESPPAAPAGQLPPTDTGFTEPLASEAESFGQADASVDAGPAASAFTEAAEAADQAEPARWRSVLDGCAVAVQPYLVLAWLAGVLVLSVRLLMSFFGVQLLARRRQPVPALLAAAASELARRLGLSSPPRVFLSERVREAIVVGLWRPMVLLPAAWLVEMPPEVLEAVIAHELAHVRRWDLWANLLQRVVETLLFYHPAVWWLSRRVSREREMCADALAVSATGRRVTYASVLELLGRLRLNRPAPQLASAMGGTKMALLDRVRNVLGIAPAEQRLPWWPAGLAALVVPLAAVGIAISLQLSAGSDEGTPLKERPPKQEESSPWSARLPNDVTVELLGLSHNPSAGRPWWKPNGEPLANRPYINHNAFRGAQAKYVGYEVAARITGEDASYEGAKFSTLAGNVGSGIVNPVDADGSNVEGVGGLTAQSWLMPGGVKSTSFVLGAATGAFEPALTTGPAGGKSKRPDLPELQFGTIRNQGDNAVVEGIMGMGWAREYNYRLMAIGNDGKEYRMHDYIKDFKPRDPERVKVEFKCDHPLDAVKELRFEFRRYYYAEFKNVSLEPGHKTEVQIVQRMTMTPPAEPDPTFKPAPGTSFSDTVEQILNLSKAPRTSDTAKLPDFWQEQPPGSKSYEIRPGVIVARHPKEFGFGDFYYLQEKDVFYVQHDSVFSSRRTYYGPFRGKPWEVLGAPEMTRTRADPQAVIAEIQRLGGRVTLDKTGKAVLSVSFVQSPITDADLKHLEGLRQLEFVGLVDTAKITDAGLAHLSGLANLKGFALDGTQVADAGLAHLKAVRQLERIKLLNNKIAGTGLEHLQGLPKLERVALSGDQVSDAGLAQLKSLTQVKELGLGGRRVTDAALEHVKRLPQLRELRLGDTAITEAGIKGLQKALPKVKVVKEKGGEATGPAQERRGETDALPALDKDSAKGLQIECRLVKTRFVVGEPINMWCSIKNTTDTIKPIGWHPSTGLHFGCARSDDLWGSKLLPLAIPQLDSTITVKSKPMQPGYILFLPAGKSLQVLLTAKAERPVKFKGKIVYDPLDPRGGKMGSGKDGPEWKDELAYSNEFEYEVVAKE